MIRALRKPASSSSATTSARACMTRASTIGGSLRACNFRYRHCAVFQLSSTCSSINDYHQHSKSTIRLSFGGSFRYNNTLNFRHQNRSFANESWNWGKFASDSSSSSNDNSSNSNNLTGNQINENEVSNNAADAPAYKVLNRCFELYSSLMPINNKLNGPLEQQVQSDNNEAGSGASQPMNSTIGNNTKYPFVFLVGNHSSGKSSFINYVCGRDVQTAGVAPTDDNFTVITSGPEDMDQDGPAFIFGNPELGFAPLRQFGPNLVHHTQLKVRKGIAAKNFMMIDSPGMIDSPASTHGMMNLLNNNSNRSSFNDNAIVGMDRGYDFQGVVRWFAERADIVLLFFDPDKPGTTGETLSILLHSLGGMDHKLLIILNKADQFEKIHDFARAYGSLCWNLSKVIPRKDLPRIFTMCLPVEDDKLQQQNIESLMEDLASETNKNKSGKGGGGLADLHSTRDDVVAEVMKAPQRRIDNVITHLYDSVSLLQMHVKICQDLRTRYKKIYWDCKVKEGVWVTSTMGLAFGITYFLPDFATQFQMVVGGMVSTSIIGTAGLVWYNGIRLRDAERDLLSQEGLSATFQRCYRREVNEGDEFIASIWQRIRGPLKSSIEHSGGGLRTIASVSNAELQAMDQIIEKEIPALRRMVSPKTNSMF